MCKIMNVFGQNGRENLWMFFQAVIAVYLLILSVIDIRWKKVSVRSLLILLAIAVLCQVLCSKGELRMMVAGGVCGGVFLFFSWFTQESFGYGDSILILILGILSGGWNLLPLVWSDVMSIVPLCASMILLETARPRPVPFSLVVKNGS